jgi:hypothetical protein
MAGATSRLRAWVDVLWRPWSVVLVVAFALLPLYLRIRAELPADVAERWHLPSLPPLTWREWAIGWLALFIVLVLEGAYRSIRERDEAIGRRDRALAHRTAAEPNLAIVFDPHCDGCYDESGVQVSLGVWNKGQTAEDVHVYLASVTPGPNLGKLELSWYGEGPVGRSINTSNRSGHHHFHLMFGTVREPYTLAVQSAVGAINDARPFVAEILAEGRNIRPLLTRVEIDPTQEPPVRRVAPVR